MVLLMLQLRGVWGSGEGSVKNHNRVTHPQAKDDGFELPLHQRDGLVDFFELLHQRDVLSSAASTD